MNLLQISLLSFIEGLTEFLPVSSTGHLILASNLLQLPQTDVQKSFEIAIQLGAILAVVALYGKMLLTDRRICLLVLVAFVPTAVIGFALHGVVKNMLLGNVSVVLASLFLGGIILMIFEKFRPKIPSAPEISRMTFMQAALVGVFQSIAIIPGVSRSGATVVGGELIGVGRKAIVEFTFLLAIPTMVAATGYDLLKSASAFTSGDWENLVVGFVLSFVVALAAVKWFLRYVKKHSFAGFGIYRIVIALFFAAYLWK